MQVKIWRRSFDVPPPPMEADHPYYEAIRDINVLYCSAVNYCLPYKWWNLGIVLLRILRERNF